MILNFISITKGEFSRREYHKMIEEIGETAGEIWNLLGERGELSLSEVQSNIAKTKSLVNMGIGWLLREDKITMSKGKRGIGISLK